MPLDPHSGYQVYEAEAGHMARHMARHGASEAPVDARPVPDGLSVSTKFLLRRGY